MEVVAVVEATPQVESQEAQVARSPVLFLLLEARMSFQAV
jgi:hypothetical protein